MFYTLNAIKNTPPKGMIYISLNEQKDFIEIILKDSGVGFTEAEKENVFKKFGRIEKNVPEKNIDSKGDGLGLYISK